MSLIEKIESAEAAGALLESTATNLKKWASADFLPEWVEASITELINKEEWEELNDRFYQTMVFGTGGIRGRTIGKVTASAETGSLSAQGTPEHAAVGTNVLRCPCHRTHWKSLLRPTRPKNGLRWRSYRSWSPPRKQPQV